LWNAVAPLELVKYIIGELSVIRGAPFFRDVRSRCRPWLFYLMRWGYGREHSYLRTQLDDCKEKLKARRRSLRVM
jgi:hypothetical protein